MRVHTTLVGDNILLINNEEDIITNVENIEYIIVENVKSIPANMFLNFKSLKKIILSDGIEIINHDAFNGCRDLEFRLPRSLKFLGTRAFAGIKNGCNLIIPGTLDAIQTDCFMYTAFKNVIIEEGITRLGDIFRGAKIEKMYLPRSLEYLALNNLNACKEIVCFADTPMEEFCGQNFIDKINVRGGNVNEEFRQSN